jgi:hypothetical protein
VQLLCYTCSCRYEEFLEASLNDRPDFVEVYSYELFDTYAEYDLRDLRINSKSDLRYVGSVLKATPIGAFSKVMKALGLGL